MAAVNSAISRTTVDNSVVVSSATYTQKTYLVMIHNGENYYNVMNELHYTKGVANEILMLFEDVQAKSIHGYDPLF